MTKFYMIAAAAALASSAAAAEDVVIVSPPYERVSFAGLDLQSSAGTHELEARIRSAARRLCIEDSVKPLQTKALERACYKDAVADGIQQAGRIIEAQSGQHDMASLSVTVHTR